MTILPTRCWSLCRSENIFSTTFCVQTKEYISLLERTAPPPPSSSGERTLPTSLRLHWWQLYRRTGSAVYCRQSGGRLGECFPRKTKGGGVLSVLRVIYSIFFGTDCTNSTQYLSTRWGSLPASGWGSESSFPLNSCLKKFLNYADSFQILLDFLVPFQKLDYQF